MKVAILYQKNQPPAYNNIVKPIKEGGYSDSGADIAYCLHDHGVKIVAPVQNPSITNDFDWVFPDTVAGIEEAIRMGAQLLWLNTVLYKGHPIEQYLEKGVYVIGQRPADVDQYDDKLYTNQLLLQRGFPIVEQQVVKTASDYKGSYPCVLKPIRGRGSQGVVVVQQQQELKEALLAALDSGLYGDHMMVEEFLPGREVTISVLPDGTCLPAVERYNHVNGVAPYNGKVAVVENSRVIPTDSALERLCQACSSIMKELQLKALIRIDCRLHSDGEYKIFDINLKPNMTGASRPHRLNQDSLTMIAASAKGLTYFELLELLLDTKWTGNEQ